MKFGFVLKTQCIPEWKEMYLNYKFLKSLIKPYKTMSKVYMKINYFEPKQSQEHSIITITNANLQFFEELKNFGSIFEENILQEFKKISNFFEFKLMDELKRWKLFKLNITILQNIQNDKDYDSKKIQLLNAFHYFYKELNLLYEYISVNQEGLRKIIKKFKKDSKNLDLRYKNLKKKIRELISKSFLKNAIQKLIFLRTEVESSYIDTFYKKYDRKDGQNTLRKISQGKLMTHQQTFLFGFFLGFVILLLIVIFALSWLLDLNIEVLEVFPLFKGMGFILIFYWTLALNVYFWMKFNINYKLIFQFNFHFSEISEIFKRASIFTVIFLIMLVWFLLLQFQSEKLGAILAIFPKNISPLIVWLVFFGYLAFPSMQLFNPMGRVYVWKLLKEIIFSPFGKNGVEFRAVWGLDQMMSFVGIARDLSYMFGFYALNSLNSGNMQIISAKDYYLLGYYLVFFVFSWKLLQGIRLMYENTQNWKLQIMCILKDFLIFILVLSDKNNNSSWLFAILLSFLMFLWDIIVDWGFLGKNAKFKYLRKELSFETQYIYYSFIFSNFLLRIMWIFTLIPQNSLFLNMNPYILPSFELFEILRRGIWNFVIIEKQHIMNCGIFKAVEEIKLPYEDIYFELDEAHFFENDFKLNGREFKKIESDISSPLLRNSMVKIDLKEKLVKEKLFDNEKFESEKIDNDNEKFEKELIEKKSEKLKSEFFNIGIEEISAELLPKKIIKFQQANFEKILEESRLFCKKVKFNMEFNFKVMKEITQEGEDMNRRKISITIKGKSNKFRNFFPQE